jgi:DNA replicative helicase MCM subunit Mcm2 (Cdc46/Mcm family)
MDPFIIVHDKCVFVDQQVLKLQEAPDMVPVGELPRHMMLWTDRYLTNRVIPGSRIVATGIFSTYQAAKRVRLLLIKFIMLSNSARGDSAERFEQPARAEEPIPPSFAHRRHWGRNGRIITIWRAIHA